MAEPDYVVIHDPACPQLDGRWYDRSTMHGFALGAEDVHGQSAVLYVPTADFEVREDGAVAQVWRRAPDDDLAPPEARD